MKVKVDSVKRYSTDFLEDDVLFQLRHFRHLRPVVECLGTALAQLLYLSWQIVDRDIHDVQLRTVFLDLGYTAFETSRKIGGLC